MTRLGPLLADVPGTVSVWCGPIGGHPGYARAADEPHYAASMMKLSVLAALFRSAEVHLDDFVRVNPLLRSAHRPDAMSDAAGPLPRPAKVPGTSAVPGTPPGAPDPRAAEVPGGWYRTDRSGDSDPEPWQRVGAWASVHWLAERMITRSSNLAANVLLDLVGLPAVADVWHSVGARHSITGRGIDDAPAREVGITNLVTAGDLAALLSSIAASQPMVDILLRQRHTGDLAAGLPPGTRAAYKNGWVRGARHAAGILYPTGSPPYILAVCTTTSLPDAAARSLIADLAGALHPSSE